MDVGRAPGLPAAGRIRWILIEDRLAIEVALDQPDAFAVANVDGRVDDHVAAIAFRAGSLAST